MGLHYFMISNFLDSRKYDAFGISFASMNSRIFEVDGNVEPAKVGVATRKKRNEDLESL